MKRKKSESDSEDLEGESEDESENDSDHRPPPLVSTSGSEAEARPPKGATKKPNVKSSTKPKVPAPAAGNDKSRMVSGGSLEALPACVWGGGTFFMQGILYHVNLYVQ